MGHQETLVKVVNRYKVEISSMVGFLHHTHEDTFVFPSIKISMLKFLGIVTWAQSCDLPFIMRGGNETVIPMTL